jgi:hypothetical protein
MKSVEQEWRSQKLVSASSRRTRRGGNHRFLFLQKTYFWHDYFLGGKLEEIIDISEPSSHETSPQSEGHMATIVIRKVAATPAAYPRQHGLLLRYPL